PHRPRWLATIDVYSHFCRSTMAPEFLLPVTTWRAGRIGSRLVHQRPRLWFPVISPHVLRSQMLSRLNQRGFGGEVPLLDDCHQSRRVGDREIREILVSLGR